MVVVVEIVVVIAVVVVVVAQSVTGVISPHAVKLYKAQNWAHHCPVSKCRYLRASLSLLSAPHVNNVRLLIYTVRV
jgi:hypothetical protein